MSINVMLPNVDPVKELYLKALKAYFKAVKNVGRLSNQPSEAMTIITKKRVYLHNANGLLAKYDIQTDAAILA